VRTNVAELFIALFCRRFATICNRDSCQGLWVFQKIKTFLVSASSQNPRGESSLAGGTVSRSQVGHLPQRPPAQSGSNRSEVFLSRQCEPSARSIRPKEVALRPAFALPMCSQEFPLRATGRMEFAERLLDNSTRW
jgi:hypothetical protein